MKLMYSSPYFRVMTEDEKTELFKGTREECLQYMKDNGGDTNEEVVER